MAAIELPRKCRYLVILEDGTTYLSRYRTFEIVGDWLFLAQGKDLPPDIFHQKEVRAIIPLLTYSTGYFNIQRGNLKSLMRDGKKPMAETTGSSHKQRHEQGNQDETKSEVPSESDS